MLPTIGAAARNVQIDAGFAATAGASAGRGGRSAAAFAVALSVLADRTTPLLAERAIACGLGAQGYCKLCHTERNAQLLKNRTSRAHIRRPVTPAGHGHC
jgi:hypothetical protein